VTLHTASNFLTKDYLKIFLDAAKDVPTDIISAKYGMALNIKSNILQMSS